MRKLIFGINITLDGCCDHTKGEGNDDVHDYFTGILKEADTLVYGRITYQLMVPFWPDMAKEQSGPTKALNGFAKAFDAVGKIVVFSRTLKAVEDEKTTIIRSNPVEEIHKLKQQKGKSIMIGGVDLPSQIIESGLIDEYHFMVQPFVVGEGRRLFDNINLAEKLQLKLAESKVFKSGFIALRYVKS